MFEDIVQGKNWARTIGRLKDLYPRIECVDGTTLSVQASNTHFCRPRNDHGPYASVEVGYPDADPPESWSPYDQGGVYGCVPVALVRQFIADHGGEINAKEKSL